MTLHHDRLPPFILNWDLKYESHLTESQCEFWKQHSNDSNRVRSQGSPEHGRVRLTVEIYSPTSPDALAPIGEDIHDTSLLDPVVVTSYQITFIRVHAIGITYILEVGLERVIGSRSVIGRARVGGALRCRHLVELGSLVQLECLS